LLWAPLLDLIWPGYENFVLSGEEMRPDSTFITELNDDYRQRVVPIKGGEHVSFSCADRWHRAPEAEILELVGPDRVGIPQAFDIDAARQVAFSADQSKASLDAVRPNVLPEGSVRHKDLSEWL
jgi:hypothetical protein